MGNSKRTLLILMTLMAVYMVGSGINFLFVRVIEPGHWDWLTSEPEVLSYLDITFRFMGLMSLTLGVFTFSIALKANKTNNRVFYSLLWIGPIYILIETGILHFWLAIIGVPISAITMLLIYRSRNDWD